MKLYAISAPPRSVKKSPLRGTHFRDQVCFEEVSLGYTSEWRQEKGMEAYLREVLRAIRRHPPL